MSRKKNRKRNKSNQASREKAGHRSSHYRYSRSLLTYFENPLIAGGIVGCIVFIAYIPALSAGFVWDDYPALRDNALLRVPGGLWKIWTTHGLIPNEAHYWPVVYTMYWVEYRLWAFNAFGYHLVNVLLHVANTALLGLLLRKMGIPGAWLAAAIFGLHPVHVESVAWVHERKDVLSALFYLAAFGGFLFYRERGKTWILAASVLLFVLAMWSKTVAVTLPVAMLIWLWYREGRFERRDLLTVLPFFIVAVGLALLDMALTAMLPAYDSGLGLIEKTLLAGRAVWFYAIKLILPFNLITIYPKWELDPGNPAQYLFPLSIAVVIAALFIARRRIGKGPLACVLFYGVTLGPTLGLIDFSFMEIAYVADRFQYLASIGPIVLFSAWAIRYVRSLETTFRKVAISGMAVLLLALGVLTWNQAAQYKDLESLFRQSLSQNPNSALAHNNLGAALVQQNRLEEAKAHFEEALILKPDSASAHNNLGLVLARQGDIEGAVRHYRAVLEAEKVGWTKTMNDLAWYLATAADPEIRNPQEAVRLAERAAQRTLYRDPAILDTLATAYAAAGRYDEAVETADRALELAMKMNSPELRDAISRRLRLYRSNQPYRMPGVPLQ